MSVDVSPIKKLMKCTVTDEWYDKEHNIEIYTKYLANKDKLALGKAPL